MSPSSRVDLHVGIHSWCRKSRPKTHDLLSQVRSNCLCRYMNMYQMNCGNEHLVFQSCGRNDNSFNASCSFIFIANGIPVPLARIQTASTQKSFFSNSVSAYGNLSVSSRNGPMKVAKVWFLVFPPKYIMAATLAKCGKCEHFW